MSAEPDLVPLSEAAEALLRMTPRERLDGRTYDEQGRLCHGDWRIAPNSDAMIANDKWYFEHKDNDGGDRYGYARTWREAMVEIDERGDQA